MIGVLEDVFRHALQKQYGTDENFEVIINADKGDLEIWRTRVVVADFFEKINKIDKPLVRLTKNEGTNY